ncbi:MAG: protein-L-isoaspartate O-methyltransferase [Steroidobacteraceae bacterium]
MELSLERTDLDQMIAQQVRTCDVHDERILDTLRAVLRSEFAAPAWRELACTDAALPLGHGKHMLAPLLVGRILQALDLRGHEQILEVGTGSGYLSACLARLGSHVRSLEIHPDLAQAARANLIRSGDAERVEVLSADGMQLAEESRYDTVVLTASLPIYVERFERALKPGGTLFVVTGLDPVMVALRVRRTGTDSFERTTLFETSLEPLENAPAPPEFGF